MASPLSHNHPTFATIEELAEFIQSPANVEIVDFCFVDPIGTWHHCSFMPSNCKLKDLKEGFLFDGSSIPLFTSIEKSDMKMMPDPTSCWMDPFSKYRTLHVNCDIVDPYSNPFDRCPRGIGARAFKYLVGTGIATEAFFGPEPEFFVFDDVKYQVSRNKCHFEIDAEEGDWQSGETLKNGAPNLGHRGVLKSYYFPMAPQDATTDLRSEMLLTMERIGIKPEKHHHEVATCQHELGFACDGLVETADKVMAYKYIVKNVAKANGKTATFMPKPMAGDNGSGMHVHQSLFLKGENLFFDPKGSYFSLSQIATWYMGGLLKHASAVLAFSNPTVNSYKRLVPGFEAPASLLYSKGNRSAAIRIPMSDMDNPNAKRIEFRCSDASSCPHLALAAMVMAGIDGIKNKIEPPAPVDVDIYKLAEEARGAIKSTPATLEAALDALESDHEFLTIGDVFPKSFIEAYIDYKRNEAKGVSCVPNPKEYELYYNC